MATCSSGRPMAASEPVADPTPAGGVYLPAGACWPLWRTLRAAIARHIRNGGAVEPELARALDAIRLGAVEHLGQPDVRKGWPVADIVAPSTSELITTAELARRLRCTERHARRIAASEGIAAAARGQWHHADAAALAARRGTTR